MFTRDACVGAASLCLAALPLTVGALAQDTPPFGFGSPTTQQELAKFFAIPPDGRGLPPGSGDATLGAKIYAQNCTSCHGDHLEGNPAKGVGGDKLIGGRGTLATKTPIKTVESYWPYATTLFDYVKRAMPFNAPGSLSDDDVYSVVAYILAQATIINPTETMNATTLPKVVMPNRDGFEPDPRPEMQLYR
ncbi:MULTISPECIES: cytochrome c [unclassified Bradyrhizobium]|uniref:c-type cytochrome n=1 Tax=unclassified Bradyrhizobium TaxID=2631580 RepID=UPI00247AEBA3|nr:MULTISPECIES: cytochrome c [unclassified Bradyrhizobium]WGS18703.1 cytochrome c [Bradyrhizobium sp. ISRA463]WGS25528.1 cytochrome c [Bradyrhizobium sp. ISRA464]